MQYNDRTADRWVCELPREDSKMLGFQYLAIEGTEQSIMEHAVPGESTMTLSRAIVDMEDPKIYIPADALIEVRNDPRGADPTRIDRDLAEKKGFSLLGAPVLIVGNSFCFWLWKGWSLTQEHHRVTSHPKYDTCLLLLKRTASLPHCRILTHHFDSVLDAAKC
mmetsp:Transcript_4092/g.11758  ORF Transcript_4092/g.11758 Transcript_4092/m.11758 type:complete len:164 (-) Transcript_4092:3791-4282(-)